MVGRAITAVRSERRRCARRWSSGLITLRETGALTRMFLPAESGCPAIATCGPCTAHRMPGSGFAMPFRDVGAADAATGKLGWVRFAGLPGLVCLLAGVGKLGARPGGCRMTDAESMLATGNDPLKQHHGFG